jgi:hypothetical protein
MYLVVALLLCNIVYVSVSSILETELHVALYMQLLIFKDLKFIF